MPGRMQRLDRGIAQHDGVAAMMLCGHIDTAFPELRFRFHQVQLCIVLVQHFTDAVDMVMVTVCQQDIGDLHALLFSQRQHRRHIPCWINNGRTVSGMIVHQVNKILHRSQFQGMDGKRLI